MSKALQAYVATSPDSPGLKILVEARSEDEAIEKAMQVWFFHDLFNADGAGTEIMRWSVKPLNEVVS